MSEIVRLDSRGRITLPSFIRETTGIFEGTYVMLIVDLENKEVRLSPFADPDAQLVEFHFILADTPGALAQVAAILAETKIDLLSASSRILKRGDSAEWTVITDISQCKYPLDEIQNRILSEEVVNQVTYRTLSHLRNFNGRVSHFKF